MICCCHLIVLFCSTVSYIFCRTLTPSVPYGRTEFPPVFFTTFKAPLADNHGLSSLAPAELAPETCPGATNKHTSKDHQHKETPRKLDGTLKEQTHQWFQNTQRSRIIKHGQFPDWFHGFLSRRQTEEILQDKPPGCFLIRFCESRVGFVLSYRGSERCRHFKLDLLGNGQYVIEGEKIAHCQLDDLVNYYRSQPVEPYNELLTTACMMAHTKLNSSNALKSHCEEPCEVKGYSSIHKPARSPTEKKPTTATALEGKKSLLSEGKRGEQARHPLFKNISEIHEKGSMDAEDLVCTYKPMNMASGSDTHSSMEICPPEKCYATMEEFHTYTEPLLRVRRGERDEAREICDEVDEPIAFYAMGRGSCKGNHDNIYSEVDSRLGASDKFKGQMYSQEAPSSLPHPTKRAPQYKATSFHSSFRMKKHLTPSSQTSYKPRGNAVKLFLSSQPKPKMQFDDPVYGYSSSSRGAQRSQDDQSELENIYERIQEDCALKPKSNQPAKH